jgi:uncharacterized membrane protein YvbJ
MVGENFMVYCTKCGTKNEDDATVCANCGASLETGVHVSRRYERRMENECFGIPRGGSIVGIIIGLIIILFGVSWILSIYYNIKLEVWPIIFIIFGILIVVGAYYRMHRKH